MNTMSASAIDRGVHGAGSNVWLFAPSGTMPMIATAVAADVLHDVRDR